MKKLNRKKKSDFIFWGVLTLFLAFLFLTPTGKSTRDWFNSFILSSPTISLTTDGPIIKEDWYLTSTSDNKVRLLESKKPILINIWATWCPPCRSELPSLIALGNKYKEEVNFLFISPTESIDILKDFVQEKDYKIDFYAINSASPIELSVSSYPTTFILNKNKRVILKSVGAHNWNSKPVHKIIDEIIKE